MPLIDSALWPLSVATNLIVSPASTLRKSGSNTIAPFSPLLSIFTSCSAAPAVPAIAMTAAAASIINFFMILPSGVWTALAVAEKIAAAAGARFALAQTKATTAGAVSHRAAVCGVSRPGSGLASHRRTGEGRGTSVPMLDRSVIAGLPPFEGLRPDDLDVVLEHARATRYARDSAVFEQDAPATSFFLLLDGHVRVVRITPEGEQIISRYINAGEMFGLAVAMGRAAYPATAIAAVDCVV